MTTPSPSQLVLRHYADEEGGQGFWYWEDEEGSQSSQPFLTAEQAIEANDEHRLTWTTIRPSSSAE